MDSEGKAPLTTSKGFANFLRSPSVLLGTLVDQPGGPRTALLHEGWAATSVWPLHTHLARGRAKSTNSQPPAPTHTHPAPQRRSSASALDPMQIP